MDEATQKPERPGRLPAILAGSALAAMVVVGGVTWKQQRDDDHSRMQQLTAENQKLSESLQSLHSESDDANATLEDVAKGLEEIRAKELKAIQSSIKVAREGDAGSGRRGQLAADIQAIRDAIHSNLQKLANRYLYIDEREGSRAVGVHGLGILEALKKIYKADALVREITSST